MANPPEDIEAEELERMTEEKHVSEVHKRTTGDITGETTEETTGEFRPETVPSQSDLFRSEGERLGVGVKRAISVLILFYYVQRTADLNNLTSVWNAVTGGKAIRQTS